MTDFPESLRRLVRERADNKCEYCKVPADISFYPHEIDHVIARKHQGETTAANLAYACWRCNRYKGTDLGSFDPQTTETQIVGLTPEGRTTAQLLQFNTPERLVERQRIADQR